MTPPAESPIEVKVDREKCSGYALCVEVCPSVFEIDDGDLAYVLGPVPAGEEDLAKEAVETCPEEAIEFVESGDDQ